MLMLALHGWIHWCLVFHLSRSRSYIVICWSRGCYNLIRYNFSSDFCIYWYRLSIFIKCFLINCNWLYAYYFFLEFPIDEYHNCWYRPNTELHRQITLFIYIYTIKTSSTITRSQLFQSRLKHFAWPTSLSPKINKHNATTLSYQISKLSCSNCFHNQS